MYDPEDYREAEGETPPTCPRCGGVHATMFEVAYPDDDSDEEYERS